MSGVVLYLLHRERNIVGEKTYTRMPERVEFNMRQAVFIKQLPELSCHCIRGYERTNIINTDKVHVSLSFTGHYVLLCLKRFQVVIQVIVHSKAADATVGFQKVFEYKIFFPSALSPTNDLICSFRQYA